MTPELTRAAELLGLIGAETYRFSGVVMPGAPYSKSRPRFMRNGRVYVKQADREAEVLTATHLRGLLKTPATGNVALVCIFYRPNKQRIDVDNMLKHVCDAANGILWIDDSQCTALLGIAELDEKNPRTVVALAPHVSTLTRGSDAVKSCELCGTTFNTIGVSKRRRFCSRKCARLAASGSWLEELVACAQCGKEFRRRTKAQKMCSPACRSDSVRGRNRSRGKPKSICPECGKTLTHNRGGRCRECWRANPNPERKVRANA